MKLLNSSFAPVRAHRICAFLLAAMALASVGYSQTFTSGDKGKVKGAIKSRNGDLVKVQDDKTGSMAMVKVDRGGGANAPFGRSVSWDQS
jgi:hypothetical protein